MKNKNLFAGWLILPLVIFSGCSVHRSVAGKTAVSLPDIPELAAAHTGICVMDLSNGSYLYNYQGDKYFIPASNTKLLTCYAAMKYLGDSLEGAEMEEYEDRLVINPAGDPTFLHPDFRQHPVYDFLAVAAKPLQAGTASGWKSNAYGTGWAWDDYSSDYMAERSAFPVYGNLLTVSGSLQQMQVVPDYFRASVVEGVASQHGYINTVRRDFLRNNFTVSDAGKSLQQEVVPFITADSISWRLLSDTLHKQVLPASVTGTGLIRKWTIRSQPTDSMLQRMMHRSDNFYAEQTLQMVSRKLLKEMNTGAVISMLLSGDYKDMPQHPRWVDGSGLSRYNLISPQDFTWLLARMKNEFSWQRITGIFQTGDEGTLSGYYKNYKGRIYAKTGTLSNNLSLSGFLLARSGKTLAFSVLVNNHQASAAAIRKVIEAFLEEMMDKY